MDPVTKEDLVKYVPMIREIENRMEHLARMKSHEIYPDAKEADVSQRTAGSGDTAAKAVEHRLAYEDIIAPIILKNRTEIARIDAAVAMLDNPLEREIIRLRYMDPKFCRLTKWNEISIRIYGDDEERYIRSCARIHKAALQNLSNL